MISVSDTALGQLQTLFSEQTPEQQVGLRVYIQSGGCSGFSYGMGIDENPPKDDDQIVTVSGLRVYVDSYSAQYLEGAEIDFVGPELEVGFEGKYIDGPWRRAAQPLRSRGGGIFATRSVIDLGDGRGADAVWAVPVGILAWLLDSGPAL